MVAKILSDLMQKHGGQVLLRFVRAHQSKQTGHFVGGGLKRQKLKLGSSVNFIDEDYDESQI